MKVNIKEVVETLDMLADEWLYFMDKRTGQIIQVEELYYHIAESMDGGDKSDSFAAWNKEQIQEAIEIYDDDNYVFLPSKYNVDEYNIMEEFIATLNNMNHYNRLSSAISGKGAFRRFKDTVNALGIAKKWYAYKEETIEKIVKDWCNGNDLEY